MNNYFSIQDIDSLSDWLQEAAQVKKEPLSHKTLGENKTIGLLFFNPTIPVVNMESAIGHPLQALTDAITITEHKKIDKPKVVLSWAPHPKALPQAVANSFVQMMQRMDAHFVITHPVGFELASQITKQVPIDYNQENAFKDADFIYVKNWSSYNDYGKIGNDNSWKITKEKMGLTNDAKFMHCLPVRRNVVVDDAVLDSQNSIVIEQANNRTYAAQLVLKKILEKL